MVIYIRNMVCVRCVMAVQEVLGKMNIGWKEVVLGQAHLDHPLRGEDIQRLDQELRVYHLEIMYDKKQVLAERIKSLILELLRDPQNERRIKLSGYLSDTTQYDYTYLANVFAEQEGSTIEKYFILQRIERIKELIIYEQMSITEIADYLQFSNVSHLCTQFRRVTGQTPAGFKKRSLEPGFAWKGVQLIK